MPASYDPNYGIGLAGVSLVCDQRYCSKGMSMVIDRDFDWHTVRDRVEGYGWTVKLGTDPAYVVHCDTHTKEYAKDLEYLAKLRRDSLSSPAAVSRFYEAKLRDEERRFHQKWNNDSFKSRPRYLTDGQEDLLRIQRKVEQASLVQRENLAKLEQAARKVEAKVTPKNPGQGWVRGYNWSWKREGFSVGYRVSRHLEAAAATAAGHRT